MGKAIANESGQQLEDEKQTKECSSSSSSWSALPPELLQLMSSHLFAGNLAMFRRVCKSWQSVDVIRPLPPPPLPHPPHCPYLLSLKENGTCRLFHPLYKGFHQIHIPELLGARIRYSKDGWLLLTQDRNVVFFNPFTMEKKQLPDFPDDMGGLATMCFSSPPTWSNWIVVGIDIEGSYFYMIQCGEETWTWHRLDPEYECRNVSHCHPILYEGDCYMLGSLGELWVFPTHLKDYYVYNAYRVEILREGFDENTYRRGFMVESDDGVLTVVDVTYDEEKEEEQVSVSILNGMDRKARRRRRRRRRRRERSELKLKLRDEMVYVSFAASFVEQAQVRGMSNKVYFPRILENSCLFYSLDSKTYSSFQAGNNSKEIPSETTCLRNSTWIHPNFELLETW